MAQHELRYEVHVSGMEPLATPSPLQSPRGEVPHWSAVSSTLVYGDTEAVLVDPGMTIAQGEHVAEWVKGFGRRLSAVYLTHDHGDHWYATTTLLEHFPDTPVYSTEGVIAGMRRGSPDGQPTALFAGIFPGKLSDTPVVAQPVPDGGLSVDGYALNPIEVGHSDTDDTTILHVPSIGLVIAGDVIYNNVHQFVGESADGGLDSWLAAIDIVESLSPSAVVAGHKDATRGDDPSITVETRAYLEAVRSILDTKPSRAEFYDNVLARFPARVNPTTVWLSALRRIAA